MKIAAVISTITGNAQKIANAAIPAWQEQGHMVFVCDAKDIAAIDPDVIVLFFWCRHGTMDDKSISVVDAFLSKPIIAMGTLGSYPDGEYGLRVKKTIQDRISERNRCLGVYLCQGKIDEKRTDKRRNLSKDDPLYLDDAAYRRHLDSRSHPDQEDLKNAVVFAKSVL